MRNVLFRVFFFTDPATTEIYTDGPTSSLHDALPSSAIEQDAGGTTVKVRREWSRRLLNELFALFIALLFLLAGLLVLLDSAPGHRFIVDRIRSEEHTSELQSLMRISYAVFCL